MAAFWKSGATLVGYEEGVIKDETHPSISIIRVNWLYSLVPGKSGNPRNSSTAMQPRDQTSIAAVYDIPNRTSGDR